MDLSTTIRLLGDLLGDVIREQEPPQVFQAEERIRAAAKASRSGDANAGTKLATEVAALTAESARAIASAFSLYFELINIAEESQRVTALNQRERERYPAPTGESLAETIGALKERGVTEAQMTDLLDVLHIELVLTAHPTEAKRRTVLSKLVRISDTVQFIRDANPMPREYKDAVASLHAEIASMWLTDPARTAKPAVTDEVRTALYFVDEIFWEALPRMYADLDAALAQHYPGQTSPSNWLTLASWVGGDRDGNPNVTHDITAETLRLHRGLAVQKHRTALQDLARRLSLSERRNPPPETMLAWLESRRPLPSHVAYLEQRYATEPYRLALALLASELETASREDMTARLLETTPHTARAHTEDFQLPLKLISEALPVQLTQNELLTLRRQFDIFGLQSARLDIREDSSRLQTALAETLRALNIDLGFDSKDDAARTALIVELLSKPVPALAHQPGATADTGETWALFRLIARVHQVYGRSLLGPFIISMTRGPADMLTVMLMAKWSGCLEGMGIVPLFETVGDLDAAPKILTDLFNLDVYKSHLASLNNEQIVMIGYSDSNKDGGYLAANWALYQGQENIAQVCRDHGVRFMLFHGRGGTVARGGGPANRAIRAQPPGTVAGRFRLTEQGETIASRYANAPLAHRHLEQIVSAVLLSSAPASTQSAQSSVSGPWRSAMTQMAATAREAYRTLVFETPEFMEFWRYATPIDEISRLRIGSRPTARRSGKLGVTNIRAIPWVFSWMQSRFNIPGWYGVGVGLNQSGLSHAALHDMYESWPFFKTVLDNTEMSMLKADLGIATLYADLVPDREMGQRNFARIRDEYERTCEAVLAATGHTELMAAEPVIKNSVERRNPYVDPLNYLQVEMLRRVRALPDAEQDSSEAADIREVLVFTINGIAAGLRNTG
jgi:phosphoenolpyruvate carboxylase